MSDSLPGRLLRALTSARRRLLSERVAAGNWEGHLSSSALSTATAVLALLKSPGGAERHAAAVAGALDWLTATRTDSGGWGDTPVSRPNIATTLLCWAAFGLAGKTGTGTRTQTGTGAAHAPETAAVPAAPAKPPDHAETLRACEDWIRREAGSLSPAHLAAALTRRYGRDKTFAVPILMACAIGGRLGPEPECWKLVPALPFELAALPRQWFAALRLPVVSYALPALIAIGQARHHHAPSRLRPWARLRRAAAGRTLRLLEEIQPEGGGFLEATPLTSFVSMALSSAGHGESRTAREALGFLLRSVRPDGSWPIDTNLATWGTTLSVKALGETLPPDAAPALRSWIANQQYKVRHPYCLSAPGGWAWTDLPGGVPDADDTAGALLALRMLSRPAGSGAAFSPAPPPAFPADSAAAVSVASAQESRDMTAGTAETAETVAEAETAEAAEAGARWLTGLQNRDGGMPTFCKGWGALPFDRSAPDLTAHALAAWQAWRGELAADPAPAMRRAVDFLARTQRADGAWLPLWFGNEWEADESNPVFGTATVLKYLCVLPPEEFPALPGVRARAAAFLLSARAPGGGWGGGPGGIRTSIEETAAALEALAAFSKTALVPAGPDFRSASDFPSASPSAPASSSAPAPGSVSASVPAAAAGGGSALREALKRGAEALLTLTAEGTEFEPAPIGLYFARLWYYERLYPVIAATAALRALTGIFPDSDAAAGR